jgi:glycogen synthase
MLTREYPPQIYGGAGVVVGELTRALRRRMDVDVRCFGARAEAAGDVAVRGYTPWERLAAGPDGPRFAPALETLSIALAMARDPVDAQVAHAHTWYADMAGVWIRTLYRIPLIVTLHSLEPL